MAVICQREAVKLFPQFSAPSPLVWESWTWVTTTCRIQEWSSCLLDWRVHTVNWRLSGQNKKKKKTCTDWTITVPLCCHCSPVILPTLSSYTSLKLNATKYNFKLNRTERKVFKCVLYNTFSGWVAVICQRKAVKLCPQFSAPSPLVWEYWTWIITTCWIQEWSRCLLDWRVHTVNWILSGQNLKRHVLSEK